MLKINTIAPDFILNNENGEEVSLKQFANQKVILYFYPKDMTSGCTNQALGFKELFKDFVDRNTVIIGISKDTTFSHKKFKEKYELPFILLSDPDLEVIKRYDVWKEKKMYGKTYFGVVRTTYLIDERGMIIYAEEKVNPNTNAKDLLCKL